MPLNRCHACKELIRIVRRKRKNSIPMPKLSIYSDQTVLKELTKRIKTGKIKIDLSFYEHIIGLSCPDYQLAFPDDWDYPHCYQIVTDEEGNLIK